jgi:GT2 family glycosyltransferase
VLEDIFIRRDPIGVPGSAIIAIPAHDEASHIERCLAALAVQRDGAGAPVARGAFEIMVYANNCTDGTAAIVRAFAAKVPHPLHVVEEQLPKTRQNAGWARKRAMDLAAAKLAGKGTCGNGTPKGFILTTDADSTVALTWFAANIREFAQGADCVAGYIDANPLELVSLGRDFLARGRIEDAYLRLIAEIDARCDPRPHDPWPNHRVASGASLAVTAAAYAAIGGLPPRAVGEDVALTRALTRAGFKVRHSMEVSVSTSCRFDGRAQGGAADTMRHRHAVPDAPCDAEIEPALDAARRAICRRMIRRISETPAGGPEALFARLQISPAAAASIRNNGAGAFEEIWDMVCEQSPVLARRVQLRPSQLPRQIVMAEMILRQLRPTVKTIESDLVLPSPREAVGRGRGWGVYRQEPLLR